MESSAQETDIDQTNTKLLHHPKAGCGKCPNCKYLEATRRIVLAECVNHVTNAATITMWNDAVNKNPCVSPRVVVLHNGYYLNARVVPANAYVHSDPDVVRVLTIEHGEIDVSPAQVQAWTPETDVAAMNGDTSRQNAAAVFHSLTCNQLEQIVATAIERLLTLNPTGYTVPMQDFPQHQRLATGGPAATTSRG